jgi:hypothetical protein
MLSHLRLYLLPLLLLLFLALLEKGLFVLYHAEQFANLSTGDTLYAVLWGIRFDLAIAALFAFLAYLGAYLGHRLLRRGFAATLQHTSFVAAALLLLLHGADMLYYGEAGRHLGYELKEGLNSGASLATAAVKSYTLPVLWQLLLLLPLYWLNRLLFRRYCPAAGQGNKPGKLAVELSLIVLLLLSGTIVRGGVQSVPLEPLHAQRIGDPAKATLALNGAYNALFSSVTPYSVNPLFTQPPSEKQLSRLSRIYRTPFPAINGKPRQSNVVFLLLESWSGAYMAPYGHEVVTTPNFDRLRREGFTTRAMLAGGSRTTEGMFASFCSAQNPLGQTIAQSQLQNYDYDCLPEILRNEGWHTAFFQGSNKETSGTGSFAQLLGFEESFGKRDIAQGTPRLEQNSWGYHDPDVYRFVLEKLRRMPQPFLIGVNTNSTHDSLLPAGSEPLLPPNDRVDRYRNILHFADGALGEFITAVRAMPELKETIFVLVADHSGLTPSPPLQQHLIPFAILAPDLPPMTLDEIANQRDIAPTLLQLLNIGIPEHFSGRDLLAAKPQRHFSDYYHQGILGWIENKRAVEFPIDAPGQLKCFSLAHQLRKGRTLPCDEHARAMQRRALAFTHTSQSLLFSGQLRRFAELR